ncbi:MAG: FxsA family protein [Solirubrobacterales bacterium]
MAFLVIVFIVVPIAELFVIIQVGQLIGVWPTLALLLADALLGSLLLRHQGRGAWRRFNAALAERRFPGKEVADGVLIVIGGTLLLTPGFITDIAGLLLLIPPTRAVARQVLRRFTVGRFTVVGVPGGFGGAGTSPPSGRAYDVDASAEEVPPNGDGAERRLPNADED